MQVKNVSPHPLDVPALRRVVQPGEVIEVADEAGQSLVEQPANWQVAKESKKGGEQA